MTMTDNKSYDQMTNDEFLEFVVKRLDGWIPLDTYIRLFPSETRLGIETRLRRGVWQRGTHYTVPRQGRAWVNLTAIRDWVTDRPISGD